METRDISAWEKLAFASVALAGVGILFLCGVLGFKIIKFPSTQIGQNLNATTKLSYKVTESSRVAVDNANSVAIDARLYYEKQLPEMNASLLSILGNLNQGAAGLKTTNTKLQGVLDATTTQINNFKPVTANLSKTLQDVDDVVTSPDVKNSLDNISETTTEAKGTMGNVQATTGDIHDAVHQSVTHCSWLVKLFHLCPTKETK